MAGLHDQLIVHQETTLAVNADSTEFCPLDTLQHMLAVGTYELEEETQTRYGELYVYHLKKLPANCSDQDNDSSHYPEWQMQCVQTFPVSGIFDMKWQPVQPARLVAACADGSLHAMVVQQADDSCQVTRQQAVQVSDKGMAVSLDIAASGQQVVSSSSDGSLSVLQVFERLPRTFTHSCLPDTCASRAACMPACCCIHMAWSSP